MSKHNCVFPFSSNKFKLLKPILTYPPQHILRYFVMSQLDWPGGNHFQQTLQCITVNSIFDLNLSPDTKSSEERKTEHHQVLFVAGYPLVTNIKEVFVFRYSDHHLLNNILILYKAWHGLD